MSETKGKLIVISGFSGVGKGTVIRRLMEKYDGFAFSVSGTTRYRREGETDGVEYFFMTKETFEEGIAAGKFLEYARYSDNYYGTPKDYVFGKMEEGIHIILDIEVQGALQVRDRCPEALMIFLIPPDADTLVRRLTGRGSETEEQITMRLGQAVREADTAPEYKAIVVNDELERTVDEIYSLVEHPENMKNFYDENVGKIAGIKRDLEEILKTREA